METRMTQSNCPTCGHVIDAASDPTGEATPEPGDFTVCLYCQDLFKFGENLRLEPLQESDIAKLPLDVVSRYQSAIRKVMAATPARQQS